MSTEHERELRQTVNTARQRRGTSRLFERLAALLGAVLFLALVLLPGVPFETRQLMLGFSVACFINAAFNSAYGRVIIEPYLNKAQAELNDYISQNPRQQEH